MQDIAAMPAGRELDALVGARVMGLVPGKDFGAWPGHVWQLDVFGEVDVLAFDTGEHSGPCCTLCGQSYCQHCGQPPEVCEKVAPPYSTNMAFGWPVVERLRERGFDVDVTARPGWQYGCRVAPKGAFNVAAVKFEAADSAPMAICLAALNALRAVGAI